MARGVHIHAMWWLGALVLGSDDLRSKAWSAVDPGMTPCEPVSPSEKWSGGKSYPRGLCGGGSDSSRHVNCAGQSLSNY